MTGEFDGRPQAAEGRAGHLERHARTVPPENYEYDFIVDGVQMLDPRNPAVKYNRGPAAISSLLDIPATGLRVSST